MKKVSSILIGFIIFMHALILLGYSCNGKESTDAEQVTISDEDLTHQIDKMVGDVLISVVPIASSDPGNQLSSRSDGCDSLRCYNNFSCTVIPNQKTTCQCLQGYIEYTDTSGVQKRVNLSGSTFRQASTGWDICRGSDFDLCFWKVSWSPNCDDPCFDFDVMVTGQGEGVWHTYNVCHEQSPPTDTVCIRLGSFVCCQPSSYNCTFDPNDGWATSLTACESCLTGYSCTN